MQEVSSSFQACSHDDASAPGGKNAAGGPDGCFCGRIRRGSMVTIDRLSVLSHYSVNNLLCVCLAARVINGKGERGSSVRLLLPASSVLF